MPFFGAFAGARLRARPCGLRIERFRGTGAALDIENARRSADARPTAIGVLTFFSIKTPPSGR
jgi:hypothetical protein